MGPLPPPPSPRRLSNFAFPALRNPESKRVLGWLLWEFIRKEHDPFRRSTGCFPEDLRSRARLF